MTDIPIRGQVRWAEVPTYDESMTLPERHTFSIQKHRPCIVVSAGQANEDLHTVTVVPVTTYRDKDRFWSIPIRKSDILIGNGSGLENDSLICPSEPWTFSLDSYVVREVLGTLPEEAMDALDYFLNLLFRGASRTYPRCEFHPGDVLGLKHDGTDIELMVVSAPIANQRHPYKLITAVPLMPEQLAWREGLRPCEVRVPIQIAEVHQQSSRLRQAIADCRQLYQISCVEPESFRIERKGIVQKRYVKAAQKAVREYLDLQGGDE
jgi:hypothetical protein